ncbi:MAG: TRAP transporter small permease [Synergistaceae bacterium]|nr:TRAP transporter small permease [Synergistota bacterium]NLM70675.1 TRAP transporter small permease [Synergistaceae bacterium]
MADNEFAGCFPENHPEKLSKTDQVLLFFFSAVCVVSSLLLALVISAAAFTRYVIGGDLYGFEEWVKLLAFWLYFMGGSYGAYNDTHVSADVIDSYMKEGTFKRLIVVIRNLITVGISLLFTWYGYDFFMFGFMGPLGTGIAIPQTTIWQIPLWTSYLAIFLGLIFMTYYYALRLFRNLRLLIKGGVS